MNKEENVTTVSDENIYKLNGRVPLKKAIPIGLQHLCLSQILRLLLLFVEQLLSEVLVSI